MDVVRPEQFLIVALFLAVLGAVWLLVRLNKGPLRSRLSNGRRMEVAEVLPLGGADRAVLLRVDGRDFLLVNAKGATPLLREMPGQSEDVA